MNIKKFFYILFAVDIVIGTALAAFINVAAGIITACVLLFINIITFIFVLKIQKVQKIQKKDSGKL